MQRAQVVGPLERGGVVAGRVAHAAAQLGHRLVVVGVHPGEQVALDGGDVLGALVQHGRGHHGDVGAHEQRLGRVGAAVHAAGDGQRSGAVELGAQDGGPAQGQAQLPRLAQRDRGQDLARIGVEVGLVEAVEQHKTGDARRGDLAGEVGERRVVRRQLDRERNGEVLGHAGDDLELAGLDVGRRALGVGRQPVEVELEGVGAGLFDELGVADPAAARRGVQAGDDRHGQALLGRAHIGEIVLGGVRIAADVGEVVERFGEALGALLEGRDQVGVFLVDLLFEERRQHDGRRAGGFEAARRGELARQRAGGSHEGRTQLKSEIRGSKAAHDWLLLVGDLVVGIGAGFDGDAALDGGKLPVVPPALVDVGLGELHEELGAGRVGAAQYGVAGLAHDELAHRQRRLLGVEVERLARGALGGLVAVEVPVAAAHRVFHVRHRLGHVDAVRDARAVGDHERRSRPGFGFEQRPDGLGVVGAQRDLRHVDVAVGAGDRAQVLLGRALAARGELGDRAARGRL